MTDHLVVLSAPKAPAEDIFKTSNLISGWRRGLIGSAFPQAAAAVLTGSDHSVSHARISGSQGERKIQRQWVPASDLADRLSHRLFELKVKTGSIAMHLAPDWREGLFRQLDMLLDEENWEPIDELPLTASYLTAMRLLIFMKDVERPGLGLSHDGNVVLSWISGKDHLTIECRSGDAVRWMVASTLSDGTRERAAGDSTARRVPTVLAAYEPDKWLKPQ